MSEEEESSNYTRKQLLENFITNNNISSFKKMLSFNPIKEKKQEQKKTKTKTTEKLRSNTLKQVNKYNNIISKNSLTQNNQLDTFKLNRYSIFNDPELKEKSMKGNYKWASMKFDIMKMNWAKRKGISYEKFQVPKKENYIKRDSVKIDGGIINGNNNYDDFDNPTPEDIMLSKNSEIINNYLNNHILHSKSLKLPKIHFGNNHSNKNNNNNLNQPRLVNNVNINFDDYNF